MNGRILRTAALVLSTLSLLGWQGLAHAEEAAASKVAQTPLRVTLATQFEGRTVSAVTVTGLKRIEPDAVLVKVLTKVGRELSADEVRGDIQTLFRMGFFEDIAVTGESVGDKVAVNFEVKERPVISKVEFEGNEKLTSSDLKDVIKVKDWSIYDFNKVQEDVALIQKHYEEKGFYLAKVSSSVKVIKSDEVQLTYKINDFDKVQIKKITFLNNKRFSDEALKSALGETREGGFFSFLTSSGNFKDSAFKQDLQRLTYWYLEHGYVKFRYENPVVTVSDDKKWLYISIYVDEGEPYSIGTIDFGGDLLFTKDELHEDLKLTSDTVFSISKRNQDILALTEKYQDLGYAFVNVIPKMNIREESKTLDITYDFEKGDLAYFGEINMVGNTKTYDKVIRRELKIHEGELYNGTRLRQSRENVERLGYFAPGEVVFNSVTPKDKKGVVNIEISVKERSTGTITLGAGFGSVQGLFFTTQISEINLLGRGQTLTLAGQYAFGETNKSLNLGFTEPYTLDTLWTTGFDVYAIFFPIPNKYSVKKLGFDVRFGHPIMEFTNAYLTYRFEGVQDVAKNANLPEADFARMRDLDNGLLSSAAVSVIRDKRNNRFETTGGNYQSISFEFAGLGGDMRYFKWIANSRYYHKILGDLVFRNNVEIGQISQYSDRDVPPAQKFYLGGPNNMKGYQLYLLGPKIFDSQGTAVPIGGNYEAFTTVELEYPLLRDAGIKAVIFADAGNTWENPFKQADVLLRMDAGMGVRWFSPFGPMRFEWGWPLNPQPGEPLGAVFQFMIGPPF